MLTKINSEELLFVDEPMQDRTNTFLSLDDYDWMSYELKTVFKTEKLGVLSVCFQYFGTVTSNMKVIQSIDDNIVEYTYEYPTDLFKKHIINFLKHHIEAWDSKYAFNGEDYVLEFFNDVIENGTVINK